MARLLVVVGSPGAGKSTVARAISDVLGWPVLSIDGERERGGDWHTYRPRVRLLTAPTILETVGLGTRYRRTLGIHDPRLLVVTCEELTRQTRLAERGYQTPAIDYAGRSWTPLRTVDTTNGLGRSVVADLSRWASEGI